VKKIGFLSFGHWRDVPGSQTRSAADSLLQTVELAQAAEDIGVDGAFVRVHHFERQLASPFPLLAAMGARTRRIEIGTAVIDMRYENPLYMAEEAAAADLISGGRLQLGVSRGPVREAFQRLIQEGLLEAHPARGVFVPQLVAGDIADLYLARGAVEIAAAQLLAASGTPEAFADLSAALADLRGPGLDTLARRLGG